MLTKEEILGNWNMFVGSQATNYGEDLTKNHDELWDLSAVSDTYVRRVGEDLCLQRQNQTLAPPPTTATTAPSFPCYVGTDGVLDCKTITIDTKRGGIRVGPTTNTNSPSRFYIDGSVSDIQEQSQIQWTCVLSDGAFLPHRRLHCHRDLCG